jgi:predicted PurR-regulated permease PerM
MKEEKTLDISWGTILKIGVLFFVIFLLYEIRKILVLTLFSLIISILFQPAIQFLEKRKIKRPIATLFIYFSFFILIGFLIFFLSSPIFSEIQKLAKFIPEYFEKISPHLKRLGIEALENFEGLTKNLQEWLIKASASIFSAISAIFGGIFATFTIFSLSVFASLEKEGIERTIEIFIPEKERERFFETFKRCQNKVSLWFGIRILGCLLVGVLTFIALKIFKIDYAFSLSLLTGFLDIIPILGPIFAGVLICGLALLNSLTKAIFVLVSFILIQQIEANVFIPLLTKRFIELSPFLILLSLLIGGKLFGFWGAILGIPLIAIIFEFSKEFLKRENF